MWSAAAHALALALLALAAALRPHHLDQPSPAIAVDLLEVAADPSQEATRTPMAKPAAPDATASAPSEQEPAAHPPDLAETLPAEPASPEETAPAPSEQGPASPQAEPTEKSPAREAIAPEPAVAMTDDADVPAAPPAAMELPPPPAVATAPPAPPLLPVVDLPPSDIPSPGSIRWPAPKLPTPARVGATSAPPQAAPPPPPAPSTPRSTPRDDPAYAARVLAWLRRFEAFPEAARRQGRSGHVHVRVHIDRHGRLLEHSVLDSAGGNDFIRATERMLRDASPLPPPPSSLDGDVVEFELRVPYRLQ